MRNQAVTIAKALAIIFMVFRHAQGPDIINNYLQLVRMPLFFFMSGYCFKDNYLYDMKTFIKKRFSGIYWPYVKWSVFFLVFHNFFFKLNIYNNLYGFHDKTFHRYTTNDFLLHLEHIIFRINGHDGLLGGYWFLYTLFWGSIIFYFTRKVFKNIYLCASVLLFLTVLLAYTSWELPFWGIKSREFFAAFFIISGYIVKSKQWSFMKQWYYIGTATIIVGIGSLLIHCSINDYLWFEIIPFSFFAIVGTLMAFGISYKISNHKTIIRSHLIYIGSHTFNILTWHFMCMKLISLLIIFIYALPIERLSELPTITEYSRNGWWTLYLFVGVEIPIIWIYGYDDFFVKKVKSRILKYLWVLRDLPYTIYFNFHFLPLKQAIYLPIVLYKPHFGSLKGKIRICSKSVKFAMIQLGRKEVDFYDNKGIYINIDGYVNFGGSCRIGSGAKLCIAKTGNVSFGKNFHSTAELKMAATDSIQFGNNVLIGWECMILTTDFHPLSKPTGETISKPYGAIYIGDNCWIANKVTMMKQTVIPKNCVIGMGSILNKRYDIPPYSLLAGSPAVLRKTGVWLNPNNRTITYDNI